MKQWLRSILSNISNENFEQFFDNHLQTIKKLFPQAGDGRVYAFPFKLALLLKKSG